MATEKQINFIATLANERDWDAIHRIEGNVVVPAAERLDAEMKKGVSVEQASAIITWLMKQPKKTETAKMAAGTPCTEAVPDGYYAIDAPNGNHKNDVVFYRVRTGKKGRWAGFQFIDLQASTTWHAVRGAEARKEVFAAIMAAGVNEARKRYGREIGCCGVCNRPLTDDHSRELGIGPVCAEGF